MSKKVKTVNCGSCGRDTRTKSGICRSCIGGRLPSQPLMEDDTTRRVLEEIYLTDCDHNEIESMINDALDDMLN